MLLFIYLFGTTTSWFASTWVWSRMGHDRGHVFEQACDQFATGDPAGDLEVEQPTASSELAPGHLPQLLFRVQPPAHHEPPWMPRDAGASPRKKHLLLLRRGWLGMRFLDRVPSSVGETLCWLVLLLLLSSSLLRKKSIPPF